MSRGAARGMPDAVSRRVTSVDLLVVLGIYALAHGLMLLNNGIYWDDWQYVHAPPDKVLEAYRDAGAPVGGQFQVMLLGMGAAASRIIVFASYLVSALCLFAILRRIREFDRKTAFLLLTFFVLFPANSARIPIVNTWYPFSYALFFIGWWLVTVHLETRKPSLRIASLLVLFASFLTQSLLVFYPVVLVSIAYHGRSELRALPAARRFVVRHLDFLLLPVIFWTLTQAYFKPHGMYRGYNRVTFESVTEAFSFIDNAFFGAFLEPLMESFRISPLLIAPAAVAAIVGARLLSRIDSAPAAGTERDSRWFLLFGIALFVIAVFPYLAVGKVPSPEEWDSRHQLLTPLGAAVILVYLPRLAFWRRVQNLIHAALVVVFIAGWIGKWIDFQRDWYKQVALIENFKATPEIERGTEFLIDDRTADLDANGRRYRPYEYSGLFQAAFGDPARAGRSLRAQDTGAPGTTVVIEHGDLKLTVPALVRLRALESWNEREFRARVRRAVRLSAGKTG